MAKDTFYFSHDYHARNDEKILELRLNFGAEGYGLFWMLVESMAENENGGAKASLMGGLSLGYGVAKQTLLDFVKYCIEIELFYEENGYIFSRRMKKHKDFREELSKNGKEGAKKRWKNGGAIGEANGGAIAPLMQRKGKESKENIIKENFNTFPKLEEIGALPQVNVESAYRRMKTSLQVSLNTEIILSMWEVFKIQNITGQNFYPNLPKVHSHYENWLMKQKFTQEGEILDKRKNINSFI